MTEMQLVYEGNWNTYEEWGGIRIFEYEKVLGEIGEQHYITVKGSWANNLVRVAKMAKMAEKVDYSDGK